MSKNNISSIVETLKRYFENKNSTTTFNPLASELTTLYSSYQQLIAELNELKNSVTDENLYDELLAMEFSLKESSFKLIASIESVTNRKITFHIPSSNENLFKIAQKYHCDILELMELNSLKKIYSVEEGKPMLIPLRNH